MVRLVTDEQNKTSLTEEEGKQLLQLVRDSEEADKKFFDRMKEARDFLQGLQWQRVKKRGRLSEVVLNLWFAHIRTLEPLLFFKAPTIRALPPRPMDQARVDTWTKLINNTLIRTDFKKQTSMAITDTLLFGEGWKKWVLNHVEDGEEAEHGNELPVWDERSAPVGLRHPPHAVIVDSLSPGRQLDTARFVAFRYEKAREDLEADDRYTLEPREVTGEPSLTSPSGRVGSTMEYKPSLSNVTPTPRGSANMHQETVTIYEVWIYQLSGMKLYKKVVTLLADEEAPTAIIRGPLPWEQFLGKDFPGWPCHKVEFNYVPDAVPMNDLESWRSIQQSINWLFSKGLDSTDSFKRITEVQKDMLQNPTAAMQALHSSKAHVHIPVKELGAIQDVNQSRSQVFDYWQFLEQLNKMADRIGGTTRNMQGVTGARTATEVAEVAEFADSKIEGKVDKVSDFLKRDVLIMAALIRAHADAEYVFQITGEAGSVEWGQFSPEEINWLPDIHIEVDSFRATSKQREIQKWTQVISVGMQLFAAGIPVRIDLAYEKLLEVMDVADPSEIAGNLVDQQMIQMVEIVQMIATGQKVPVIPGEDYRVHLDTITGFMNTETFNLLQEPVQQIIIEHALETEQKLKESTQTGQAPRNAGEIGAATQANLDRGNGAQARGRVAPIPGTGGELR